MTHAHFLKNKDKIEKALYNVMFEYLSKLSLDELKQIDWFTCRGI